MTDGAAVLRRWAESTPLVAAGVGSGLTARGAVEGGADLLACYGTACYRVMGLPSALSFLPYADVNELVVDTLPQVVAAATDRPVLAGVGAHDPRRDLRRLVERVASLGAAGVTNEPFIGMYEGDLRGQLEAAGLGFDREVALVETAAGMGLLTLGWAWTPDEARRMVQAGTPVVGAMLGVSAGGELGSRPAHDMRSGIDVLSAIVRAARSEDAEVLVLLHGGPLNAPDAVAEAVRATGAHGYVAGSTAERTPAVAGIAGAVAAFKGATAALGKGR